MDFKVTSRFVVFWICCVHFSTFAQQDEIASRQFTMKDGLPDQQILDVIQDRQGFVWLATYSGLSKFDGYRFTTFKHNATIQNSLTSNNLNTLFEDSNGKIWIGHSEGLDVFDPVTETFYYPWPDSLNLNNRFNNEVIRFRQRKDGRIWICTANGVFLADPATNLIQRVTELPRYTYFDIAETSDGSVWAASVRGLIQINDSTGQISQYVCNSKDPNTLSHNFVRSLKVDRMDRLWIGTNRGIDLLDRESNAFTHFAFGEAGREILENTDGSLLIASSAGLVHFNSRTGKHNMMSDDQAMTVMRDKQGLLWLGSTGGLRLFNPKKEKFEIHNQYRKIGLLYEDASNQIWMAGFADRAQEMNSLFNSDSGSKQFDAVYFQPGSSSSPVSFVTCIFPDDQGSLWFSSNDRLIKFDWISQSFKDAGLETREAIALHIDSNDNIWLGHWDWVGKWDGKTLQQLDAFPSGTVYSFLEDTDQNLWIGTSAGLIRYNLSTGKRDVFKNDTSDPQSLSNNSVYHLLRDKDGIIWIGTGGGLNQLINTTTGFPRFRHWSVAQGLSNDDVYAIVDGKDGTLWMTCGNMISHFFQKEGVFRNYDDDDGLSGKNFRGAWYLPGKGLMSHTGEVYFGSTHGLVAFHPDSLYDNSFIPPVKITGFSIDNKSFPVRGNRENILISETPIQNVVSYTDQIELTNDQNDFTFEFAALNYVYPESNQYKYKLEPYEKEWIETSAVNRVARYTNINPGKYTFRVIGSNDDGVWNEEGASIMITIAPPWWQTWWAYSFYGIAFVGLLAAGRRTIIQREHLAAKFKLEHLELEKVQEINKVKTNFFANISHEFRTPITLILGPLKDLYDHSTSYDQRSLFGTMLRNGQRLLRLVNQLLDLSRLEAGKMKLHASGTDLVQFLHEMASSYESLAIEKHIKFVFYPQVEELIVYVDLEKMEKVVHNLLSNAFKFTGEGGEVVLNLKVADKHAMIRVKDTGIGIPEDELEKVFDRFYQVDSSQTRGYEGSGIGMALAKELVELHHGTISVESKVGAGSTFTVRLPLGKEHLRKEEILPAHPSGGDIGDSVKTAMNLEDLVALENTASNGNGTEKATVSSDQPVVLIVEDNVDMRHYIVKTLSGQYQIIEAENGKAGAAIAKESLPDLIISDIMMPEMDGYKLCELIKSHELTSHIPVILLTARADRNSKLSGLIIGADDYLSKPFDAEELKVIVRNRIIARQKMQERFSREITLEPRQIAITSLDEKFLTKVLAIIEEHMDDEHFSIDELSREAGYSNMHFYRKIKALAGQTPSQFLRTIRLKRAAELLSKNSDNVTQIAYSVGFSSLSYFSKCFKEQFGVTPGQFEAKNKV